MNLKDVQETIEDVMKELEDVNYQENRKIFNQTKVNKAYDKLFELRKELIQARKRGTKDE